MKYERTYILSAEENEGATHYFVSFKSAEGTAEKVEVVSVVYEALKKLQTKEESQARKSRRYPPISDLSDEELYTQAVNKPKSIEDAVFNNLLKEQVSQAISELPETMKRRLLLYYSEGLTYKQIAEKEGKNPKTIFESIKAAEKKIYEKIKFLED